MVFDISKTLDKPSSQEKSQVEMQFSVTFQERKRFSKEKRKAALNSEAPFYAGCSPWIAARLLSWVY